MAQANELQSLVEHFVSQLQEQISRQVQTELAGRIDTFKATLLGGIRQAPQALATTGALKAPGRRGPRAGYSAEEKPCPVCRTLNKARRFSYLCEKHRTPENLKKFKRNAKAAPSPAPAAAAPKTASAKPAAPQAAPPSGKRGPGRPKGSKNKPKAAAAQAN